MKKLSSLFFVIWVSSSLYSQKIVDGIYVNAAGDSIKTGVVLQTDVFNKKQLSPIGFDGQVFIKNPREKKRKLKESEVRYLTFVDFSGNKREFVSSNQVSGIDLKNKLIEKKFNGMIDWYVDFFPSSSYYDLTIYRRDYFARKGNEAVEITLFNSNYKKKLKNLTNNDPKYISQIDNIETEQDIIRFLKDYSSIAISK